MQRGWSGSSLTRGGRKLVGGDKTEAVLTRRQREIATLVAQGLSNRQIADKLVISERTAEFHVEQIMNRLGFHSRAEIAAWTAGQASPSGTENESTTGPAVRATATTRIPTVRRPWLRASAVALLGLVSVGLTVYVQRLGQATVPTIRTVAGTGVRAVSADGNAAALTDLSLPLGMVVDSAGELYFVDGNRVRKMTPTGTLLTVAGTSVPGYSGDGGEATSARLYWPQGLAIDTEGALYIGDTRNHRVRKIDPTGTISTVAGTGDAGYAGDGGPAMLAQLDSPVGVAVGFGRSLYVADSANHRVRRIDPHGVISTVVGTGELGYAGDGGPATSAPLGSPEGLAFDGKGNLYITDSFNNRVRKVDVTGTITTVAGSGVRGFSGDGAKATLARLNLAPGPLGQVGQIVAVDPEGNLYIADTTNNRVRRVSLDGTIATLAGTVQAGSSGDGGPAPAAELNAPLGVAVDPDGGVYIADTENNLIRRVNQ